MNLPKIITISIIGFLLAASLGALSIPIISDIGLLFYDFTNIWILVTFLFVLLLFLFINGMVNLIVEDQLINISIKVAFILGFVITTVSQYPTTSGVIPVFSIYFLMLITLVISKNNVSKEYSNLIKPRVGSIFAHSSKGFTLVLALSLSLVAYAYYSSPEYKEKIRDQIAITIVDPTVTAIESKINSEINSQVDNMEQKIDLNMNGMFGGILDNLNIDLTNISGDLINPEKLTSSIRPMVEDQIYGFIEPYEKYIPIIFALLFYFFISLTITISMFLLPIISNTIISILLSTGFLETKVTRVDVERLTV